MLVRFFTFCLCFSIFFFCFLLLFVVSFSFFLFSGGWVGKNGCGGVCIYVYVCVSVCGWVWGGGRGDRRGKDLMGE